MNDRGLQKDIEQLADECSTAVLQGDGSTRT